MTRKKEATGFTLIEILVALGIFSVVMVLVTISFRTVLDIRTRINHRVAQLHQLQLAMLIIERDITQMLQYGDRTSSLVSNGLDSVQFVRGGVINPLARHKRSTLQVVNYSFSGGELVRTVRNIIEEDQKAQPVSITLLSDVAQFRVQFWTHQKQWINEWPEEKNTKTLPGSLPKEENPRKKFLPKAITLIMEMNGKKEIARTFLVPIGDYHEAR